MQQLELECESCDNTTLHDVLKAQTSQKRGFSFQGTIRCSECGATRHAKIRVLPPLELELRLSEGGETVREKLLAEPGDLLQVGELLSHARGPLEVTALELGARKGTDSTKRVQQAKARERPIVWARLVATVRVRFALHRESETLSLKQELSPETELAIGMVLQLDGGRRVTKAAAWDLKRVTCRRKGSGRGQRGNRRKRPQHTSSEHSDEARKRLTGRGGRRKG